MSTKALSYASAMLPSDYTPNHEVRSLTGLRGIAALDVVLGHYDIHNNPFLHPFVFNDAAVDIFFCLSSFTLCLVYLGSGKSFNLRSFAVARFARIYPLFFLMMAVGLLTGYFWGDEAFPRFSNLFIIKHTLAQLAFVAALPIKSLSGFWNPAAWSVAIEAVCYVALFPLCVLSWPLLLRASSRLLLVGSIFCGIVCHVTYALAYDPLANVIGFPAPSNHFAYWVALVRGLTMFTAGALAFAVFQVNQTVRRATGLMTDAVMLLIVAIIAGGSFAFVDRHALVIFAPLLIMGLMDERSLTGRVLASPPLHFLGLISYSIYLWHLPLYQIVLHLHPAFMAAENTRILAPVIATLLCATVSYYFYEAPARRLIRQLLLPTHRKSIREHV